MGFLHQIMPLGLFDADVEQADPWPCDVVYITRDDRAHQGELQELHRSGADIGAKIEQVGMTPLVGDRRHDRRTLHLRQALQDEVGDGGEGAGIAGADHRRSAPFVHEINGDAHRGVLFTADRLERRVLHRDDLGGRDDLASSPRRHTGRHAGQARLDRGRIPDQQQAQIWIGGQSQYGRRHTFLRTEVAAHDIERDDGHGVLHRGSGRAPRRAEGLNRPLRRRRASRSRACRDRNRPG